MQITFLHLQHYDNHWNNNLHMAQKLAPFLYALTSSNINWFSKFYLFILLTVLNDVITDLIGSWSVFFKSFVCSRDVQRWTVHFGMSDVFQRFVGHLEPHNQNPSDATLAPLSILQNSRWRPRWPQSKWKLLKWPYFLCYCTQKCTSCVFLCFATKGIWWNGFQVISVMLNTRWRPICKLRRPLPKLHFLVIAHYKYEIKGWKWCLYRGFQGLWF